MRAIVILLPLLLISCDTELPVLEAEQVVPEQRNGLVYHDGAPLTGRLIARYDNGSIESEKRYWAGHLHDTSRTFDVGGRLLDERIYHNGKKVGLHRGWYSDGTPRFRYTFVDDRHEGEAIEWFENGQVYRKFHYVDGHEEGRQMMYDEEGTLRANYVVRDGRRYGSIGRKPCR